VPGITFDGGYAEFMLAPAGALARIPGELGPADAAPLLCAGVTTYNSLRNSGARAGDLVAVLGIGGLGHLAVQYAAKMGFQTVAVARGKDKEPLARKLGAQYRSNAKGAASLQCSGVRIPRARAASRPSGQRGGGALPERAFSAGGLDGPFVSVDLAARPGPPRVQAPMPRARFPRILHRLQERSA
jgi:hypothetical protein